MFFVRNIKSAIFFAASLILSVLIYSAAYAGSGYLVEYSEETGLLSIDVSNASLKRVLQDISSQGRVTVFFDPEAEKQVTLSINDAELGKGLGRLLRDSSHAMVYEKVVNNKGQIELRLKKISVFKEGGGEPEELIVNKEYSDSEGGVSDRDTETGNDSYIPPPKRASLSKEERDAIKKRQRASRLERKANKGRARAGQKSSESETDRK